MIETTKRIIPLSDKLTEKINDFFGGRIYPAIVAAAVLIGHITALEFYIAIPLLLASAFAFLTCDSVKHFIPTLITFLYLVNNKHTPGSTDGIKPGSDYYSQPFVFVTMAVVFSVLLISVILYTVFRLIPRIKDGGKPPLILPLSLLAAAFILNGAFTSGWQAASLLFGFAEAAVYFLLFYLFYYGLKGESVNRLIDYVCYAALLSAIVIICQMIFMYATNDALIVDGAIRKEELSLGWGISNPVGNALVMLVPLLMLGVVRSKRYPVYLTITFLTCAATLFTLSRNAIVVCLLVLTAAFVTAYFTSERKKLFGITLACAMGAVMIVALIFSERIGELLDYFSRMGSADNGRFKLWGQSFNNFLEAPIFGKGFFDWGEMEVYEIAGFVPTMSHNTFFQLMSSMGIFGLGAYVFYRVKSLLPFFKNVCCEKLMLLYSILALLIGGMLDNFIFYFQGVFLYVILLALIFLMSEFEERWAEAHEVEEEENDEYEDEDY